VHKNMPLPLSAITRSFALNFPLVVFHAGYFDVSYVLELSVGKCFTLA
jgi:hypothetical protein